MYFYYIINVWWLQFMLNGTKRAKWNASFILCMQAYSNNGFEFFFSRFPFAFSHTYFLMAYTNLPTRIYVHRWVLPLCSLTRNIDENIIQTRKKSFIKNTFFYQLQCQLLMSTKCRMWKFSYAIIKNETEIQKREIEKEHIFVALIIMYTNYLSILSLFWKISCHCFTICHTFCSFDSFNRHQQLLYIVTSILFYSNFQLAAGFFIAILCMCMFVSDLHWNPLFSFLSANSCETWKHNNNNKKYIRIFRLAFSFGFYRTAMMMEMQMRWHNHSNLIHSIDLKQNLFETKDLCANTQSICRWKFTSQCSWIVQSCTASKAKETEFMSIASCFSICITKYILLLLLFVFHFIVLCATRKIHCIRWLNLWFMDFI